MSMHFLKRLFTNAHNFVMERVGGTRIETKEWQNTDGSIANVSVDAKIEAGSHIPRSAIVMPGAVISANDTIQPGDIVTSAGRIRFDNATAPKPAR